VLLVNEERSTPPVENPQILSRKLSGESGSQLNRRTRESIQAFIQDVLQPDLRAFCLCRKAPIGYGSSAVIKHNLNKNRSSWGGLHLCKSFNCPTCGARRRFVKAKEVQVVMDEHTKAGGSQLAAHFTTDDNAFTDLKEALEFISDCLNRMFSGRFGKMLKDKYGYDGYFRVIESTINIRRRGHHPHAHLIVTFNRRLSHHDIEVLSRLLVDKWCGLVESKSGGSNKPYKTLQSVHQVYHSDQTKDYGQQISKYLMKVCSGITGELTHSQNKHAKHQGSFGILEGVQVAMEIGEGHQDFWIIKKLVNEYLESSKGKRLFSNSRDFFKRYEVEEADEDQAFEEEEEDQIVDIEVRQPIYNALNNYKQLSNVLTIVEQQEDAFFGFLDLLERCEEYEDQQRARWKHDTSIMAMAIREEGFNALQAWELDEEILQERINRRCDAEVYMFVREFINKTGEIRVRWFKDYHATRIGVRSSRRSYQ
jgi:hypothetical protein